MSRARVEVCLTLTRGCEPSGDCRQGIPDIMSVRITEELVGLIDRQELAEITSEVDETKRESIVIEANTRAWVWSVADVSSDSTARVCLQ